MVLITTFFLNNCFSSTSYPTNENVFSKQICIMMFSSILPDLHAHWMYLKEATLDH